MRTWIGAGTALLLPAAAHAQDAWDVAAAGAPFSGSYFFVSIVAGLILAIGFQLVLTNLSMAAGVSAVGPFDEASEPGKVPRKDVGAHLSERVGRAARKITTAFGLWTIVTASVALFFASWLAVELSLTLNMLVGAVLGLTIWALFYVVMVSFEAAALWSMAGSLARTVSGGLQSAWRASSSMFAPSPRKEAVDTATEVARAVRQELISGVEMGQIRDDIGRWVAQLTPPRIDPAQLRREIVQLLDDVELRAVADHEGLQRDKLVAHLQARPGWTAAHADQIATGVQSVFQTIREERAQQKSMTDKIADSTLRVVGGMSADQAHAWRGKFEAWLRSTGVDALDPEAIKRDLDLMWSEPAAGADALRARLSHVDRNTVAQLLAQRGDIPPAQAQRIVDTVDEFFRNAAARVQTMREGATMPSMPAMPSVDVAGARERAMGKLQAYFDGLGRPELTYEGIRGDLQRLFEDPRGGIDALLARLRAMDRDSVKAVLATAPGMTPDRANNAVEYVLRARDEVVAKADRVRADVERRVELAREEAWREAEEARKTAASAAWWGFGTAVLSGGAAVAGGIVAVAT